jgi:hypothetical protein
MNKIILIVLIPFILACGGLPAVVATTTGMPGFATQTPQISTETAKPTNDAPKGSKMPVSGCWYVRDAPSLDGEVLRTQCGGFIVNYGLIANGYVQIEDGYICNRAIGGNEECFE